MDMNLQTKERFSYVTSSEGLTSSDKAVFDHIAASRGHVSGVFSVLMGSSEVAKLVADLGEYMRFRSVLSDRVREITISVTLAENSAQYEWGYHVDFMKKVGVNDATVDVIKYRKGIENIDAEDADLINYARCLLWKKRVSESVFSKIQHRYTVEERTEITALIGYYNCVSTILNAAEVAASPGKDVLPEPTEFNQ